MYQPLPLRTNSHFPTAKSAASEKHERALGLYAGGQFESAVELLRQALLEAPSCELANDIAAAEVACGRREQALAQFFLATSLNPENIEAVANLGTLLAHMDRMREAVPYFQPRFQIQQAPLKPGNALLNRRLSPSHLAHRIRERLTVHLQCNQLRLDLDHVDRVLVHPLFQRDHRFVHHQHVGLE